jgi:hypothetical protein
MNRARWTTWIFFLAAAGPACAEAPAPDTRMVLEDVSLPTRPAAPAVRRNQPIVLVATANGIRLSAPGRALKDGQAGDTIPVLNTATRTALKGVVRDGWIELQSPGDPTP